MIARPRPFSSAHCPVSRRRFLKCLPLAVLAAKAAPLTALAASRSPVIMTVRGPIRPRDLGFTLTHEHVLVDFIGADQISPNRYDSSRAYNRILPYLKQLRKLGGRSLVECTPAYLGRDPLLLKRLSRGSGLHLVTNTGYYGAVNNKFLPAHAHTETPEQLAERWLTEWRKGIEGSGVRPGLIKIGVEGDTLSDLHAKLVRAAALTHLGSGLTIASHTGSAKLAEAQLRILRQEGVGPEAFIFVHAQAESDQAACVQLADQGAWISYDSYRPEEVDRYINFTNWMRKSGLLGRLLLSHDAGWFKPGEPDGGEFRPFNDVLQSLVPALLKQGMPPSELLQLFEKNPAQALAIRIRRP